LKAFADRFVEYLFALSEIGFDMGVGTVQTLEGLVQNRNDPPLFLQRRE